ncbi:uncharacterized protein LOC115875843 [Sitophilus oryzae]|uniref:Uncharacterized protein LOC115875843 n=1 Tax=Sitophilus oryzae TaxID=7048 RepID=A0A6J2X8D2_SITOR|nr:uncharacterized protein LOC115875843 [Sitophilus oryzae]
MNPMSTLLNHTTARYKIDQGNGKRLNHLLYMDDLKLYGETPSKLNDLIETVQVFSRDIHMSFGFDKCATVNIKRGKIEDRQQVICNIKQLAPKDTYRYLGLAQNSTIDHTTIKREIREKYNTRLMKLLNTKLSGHNLIKAINAWAILVLTYSFGVVKGSNTDLEDLDRLTRRQLTKFRNLHTNSSVYRLYVPRRMGGRGLLNIKDLCLKQENGMRQRFMSSNCAIMMLIVAQDKGYTPLNLSCRNRIDKPISIEERVAGWKKGALHGRYPKSLQSEGIDLHSSLAWLKDGKLFPETEGFMMAIQDGVMRTRNYEKNILKQDVVDVCRKCSMRGETIEHITSGCSTLADNAYLGRHNQLAKIIHQQLAIKSELLSKTSPPYYKYSPQPVLESRDAVLYWDRAIITDRTVDHNRPDIFIDKINKTGIIIDIAVPLSCRIKQTETDKITKYENLSYDLKNVWNLKTIKILPFVISVEGIISTEFQKNLKRLIYHAQLQK